MRVVLMYSRDGGIKGAMRQMVPGGLAMGDFYEDVELFARQRGGELGCWPEAPRAAPLAEPAPPAAEPALGEPALAAELKAPGPLAEQGGA